MHIGYQLSNILESVAPQEENNVETLYLTLIVNKLNIYNIYFLKFFSTIQTKYL